MPYTSLQDCINDLEAHGHLIRIKEEIDPNLEMAAVHLSVYQKGGPALLFERVKGSRFQAASNIFGTLERSKFIFRNTLQAVQQAVRLKNDPMSVLKSPFKNLSSGMAMVKALPRRISRGDFEEIRVSDLPLIKHWPKDGGAFITLPQVFSEDPDRKGLMHANLGMYRIQLDGNQYVKDHEIGLHYQIHRGIGVHQSKAVARNQPLKVSVFVGGPPAHTLAAVMPLPEGLSELTFAGLLAGRRFRYYYEQGYCISADADFVITGEIYPHEVKPEGPFGDHLGYYSLTHDFPVMRVNKVYAKRGAIWPFTVVGRPPQEDTSFGLLIHELTGEAIPNEIPGLKEVNAVDAAGVHPLLLAIGQERYTPYSQEKRPAELLTIANRVLGTGQLSLAKYLFICSEEKGMRLSTHRIEEFFRFILERFDPRVDLHFQTQTTIDTLDYSGQGLNKGSKLIVAACGDARRQLDKEIPAEILQKFESWRPRLVMPGVIAIQTSPFESYEKAEIEMETVIQRLEERADDLRGVPLIVLCDDSSFVSATLNNFLWVAFTRSNPSHDIYGVGASYRFKHWGCTGPLIIDARIKPHHAPPLESDATIERSVERFFRKGGSLYGVLPGY